MLYLVTFLTFLVSVLIYTMDPVSNRQQLENRTGEAFVVGLLNQHQSARDYMYQWLGRVYPGQLNTSKIECLQNDVNGSITNSCSNPAAISLPARGLDQMIGADETTEKTLSLAKESYVKIPDNKTGNRLAESYLKRQSVADEDSIRGHYISALVCLSKARWELAPCYVCKGEDGGDIGCDQKEHVASIQKSDAVETFLVTYSIPTRVEEDDGSSWVSWEPDWWQKEGPKQVQRKQLWRRALTRRSHSSYNCGVLVSAPTGMGWMVNNSSMRRGHQVHNNGMRVYPSEAGGHEYCIDNGQRCMRVVPNGIVDFLKKVTSTRELDDMLFCMSEVGNPYTDPIPTFHFDGVDSRALGAPAVAVSSTDFGEKRWRATTGEVSGRAPKLEYVDSRGTVSELDFHSNREAFIKLKTDAIRMPFSQPDTDFTLSFIVYFFETESGTGNVLNNELDMEARADGEDLFSFSKMSICEVDGGTLEGNGVFGFRFLTEDRAVQQLCVGFSTDSTGNAYQGLHNFIIVRKSGQLSFYWDGWQMCNKKVIPETKSWPVLGKSDNPVRFSGVGNMYLVDVRYYGQALSNAQIKKNFAIDHRRYGVNKASIKEDPTTEEERSYLCEIE